MEGVRQPLRKNIYHLNFWRITVLTSRLFRLEYSREQQFEDQLSQIVVNRDFDEVACNFSLDGDAVRITTADSVMWFNRDSFDFSVKSPCDGSVWSWGDPLHNLGGTARTLDNADGAIPLEDGIFSEEGIGILEDRSCLLNDSGELCPRSSNSNSYVKTNVHLLWEKEMLTIHPTVNQASTLKKRRFVVCFCGVNIQTVSVEIDSKKFNIKCAYDESINGSVAVLPKTETDQSICIHFYGWTSNENNIRKNELFLLLQRAQLKFNLKEDIFRSIEKGDFSCIPDDLYQLPVVLREAISELVDP